MRSSELDYELPQELIAQHPLERRDASRLLVHDRASGETRHRRFHELPAELAEGTLVVGFGTGPELLDVTSSDDIRRAVERYDNIGIRIEDDYLITPTGVEWLSRAPREIDEVEAAMRQAAR